MGFFSVFRKQPVNAVKIVRISDFLKPIVFCGSMILEKQIFSQNFNSLEFAIPFIFK